MDQMERARKILEAQHQEAKAMVAEMIRRMGRKEFIEFYILVHKKMNRDVINSKEVEEMIEEQGEDAVLY